MTSFSLFALGHLFINIVVENRVVSAQTFTIMMTASRLAVSVK